MSKTLIHRLVRETGLSTNKLEYKVSAARDVSWVGRGGAS